MKLKKCIWIAILAWAVVSCLGNNIVYNTKDIEYRTMDFATPIAKVHVPFYQNLGKKLDNLFVNNDGVSVRFKAVFSLFE